MICFLSDMLINSFFLEPPLFSLWEGPGSQPQSTLSRWKNLEGEEETSEEAEPLVDGQVSHFTVKRAILTELVHRGEESSQLETLLSVLGASQVEVEEVKTVEARN